MPVERNTLRVNLETDQNWAEVLMGETLVCSLLSQALYVFPEKAWLQSLIDGDVFSETPFGSGQTAVTTGLQLLQAWSKENQEVFPQVAFDAIEADYMRLLVGPQKPLAPPWESVYRNKDHILFQRETLQVRNWYRRFGLQIERLYNEPDDHLGIEFSFLAYLAQSGLQAVEEANQERLLKLLKAQREFIRTHLSRWVPLWYADVETHARTPFYLGIAQFACGVLDELHVVLRLPAANKVKQQNRP